MDAPPISKRFAVGRNDRVDATLGILSARHESLVCRTYKLRPGSGAAFHRIVVEESVPMLQRWGVDVIALGPSLDDDDSYYLIRLYASLEERQRSQDAFYGTNTTSSTCQRRVITSF